MGATHHSDHGGANNRANVYVAPIVDPVGVHKQLFGMNGFELVEVVQIFADGFENGSTSEWSLTVP